MLYELKNFDYPLDQCLKLCQEYNITEATAFLLERSGAVLEALKLYIEVFLKFLKFFDLFKIKKKIFEKNIQKAIRKIEKGKTPGSFSNFLIFNQNFI